MTSRRQAAGLPAIGLVTAFVIVLVFGGLLSSSHSDQDPTTKVVKTPASAATASTAPATSVSAPVHFTVALVTVPASLVPPVPGKAPAPVVSSLRLCLRPDPGWTVTNLGDGWTADQNGQRFCRPITLGADPGEELNVQLEQR